MQRLVDANSVHPILRWQQWLNLCSCRGLGQGNVVRKVVITCNVFIERFLPCKIAAKQVGHGCSWNMMDMVGICWNDLPIFVTWHELWTDAWIESMDSLLGQHRRSRPCCKRMWGTCSLQLGLIGSLGGYCSYGSWHRCDQDIHVPHREDDFLPNRSAYHPFNWHRPWTLNITDFGWSLVFKPPVWQGLC